MYLYIVLVPVALLIITASVVTKMQEKFPDYLPEKLRSWDFLPEPLHSLDPYDRLIQRMVCCKKHKISEDVENTVELNLLSENA